MLCWQCMPLITTKDSLHWFQEMLLTLLLQLAIDDGLLNMHRQFCYYAPHATQPACTGNHWFQELPLQLMFLLALVVISNVVVNHIRQQIRFSAAKLTNNAAAMQCTTAWWAICNSKLFTEITVSSGVDVVEHQCHSSATAHHRVNRPVGQCHYCKQ